MRLNHVNLSVDDLDEAQDLFQRFFDFRLLERKGNALAVMTDGLGFTLVLSDRRAFGSESPTRYPEASTLGSYWRAPSRSMGPMSVSPRPTRTLAVGRGG